MYDSNFWEAFLTKYPQYNKNDSKKLFKDIFDVAGNILISQPHGVVLDGIGYFSNVIFQNKKRIQIAEKTIYNFTTNGWIYTAYMFPRLFRNTMMSNWSFQICREKARKMGENINNGLKYYCHYDILRTIKKGRYGFKYFM